MSALGTLPACMPDPHPARLQCHRVFTVGELDVSQKPELRTGGFRVARLRSRAFTSDRGVHWYRSQLADAGKIAVPQEGAPASFVPACLIVHHTVNSLIEDGLRTFWRSTNFGAPMPVAVSGVPGSPYPSSLRRFDGLAGCPVTRPRALAGRPVPLPRPRVAAAEAAAAVAERRWGSVAAWSLCNEWARGVSRRRHR